MNSKDAIELIKSDVAHLVKTITQQDKMLELACNAISDCPHDSAGDPIACFKDDTVQADCIICWRKYLQSEVSK